MQAPLGMQSALQLLNSYRQNHHADPLTWSDDLGTTAAEYAQVLASARTFVHGGLTDSQGRRVGQNLAWTSQRGTDARFAVTMWYKENSKYDYDNPGYRVATGHFTQLVWKATTQVGIGIVSTPRKTVVVANFYPPGNLTRGFVQNVAAPARLLTDNRITMFPWASAPGSFSRFDGRGCVVLEVINTDMATAITGYRIVARKDKPELFPSEFQLRGSNDDGETWTVIDARSGIRSSSEFAVKTRPFGRVRLVISRTNQVPGTTEWGTAASIPQFFIVLRKG